MLRCWWRDPEFIEQERHRKLTGKNYDNRFGLWEKQGQNGGYYYNGKIKVTEPGEYWVNVYVNDRKETERHPDFNLTLNKADATRQAPQRHAPKPVTFQPSDFNADDIPF